MRPSRLVLVLLFQSLAAQAAEYRVGPDQAYASIGAVPWEALQPGDTVYIHARLTPYVEKWVLGRRGTATAPITVRGVRDEAGNLPVIVGENATTRSQLDFWNEQRGILKIGGANSPADTLPAYIVVEDLHLRRARGSFTGRSGSSSYTANAAAIFIEKGEHITIRGCVLEDSGNGLFIASETSDVLVERNEIRGNGNTGSIKEHNAYTEALGITYQFNRFGPLCVGCQGNNLKDRSAGTVIRYNWIEGGNRQLDLVDSESPKLLADASYGRTFVYGNVLIEHDGAGNRQIIHFGGDSGNVANYRPQLYLFHNTVVSTRTDRTTLLRLSDNTQTADVTSNVVMVTASGSNNLSLSDEAGTLRHGGNWYAPGYLPAFGPVTGAVVDTGGNLTGSNPGFVDPAGNYHLEPASPLRGKAVAPPAEARGMLVDRQYVKHRGAEQRVVSSPAHIGAFGDSGDPIPGSPDPETPDSGVPDPGTPDAGPDVQDSGTPDAGPVTPDSGTTNPPGDDDGGCGATGGGFAGPLGLLFLAALTRRRRPARS
ncbi:polysaccharide-degrading enzyme [Myxococcus sp. K15C18031901]|uniref:MYXO-CTERM sorting domain-containing protein n=1 Tax=Myxococcus dinghuensis TaxID=2906761 RepID=UPI0020A82D44|nr:MYXO-CTERM sorting domain-containing protein [Myxococcus dinghuensis]MCP3104672.1 polysaccharide-degrading enzyme [Myxococcus dinghuensis]